MYLSAKVYFIYDTYSKIEYYIHLNLTHSLLMNAHAKDKFENMSYAIIYQHCTQNQHYWALNIVALFATHILFISAMLYMITHTSKIGQM